MLCVTEYFAKSLESHPCRGVAGFLWLGVQTSGGLGDRCPPVGSRGRAPVGVWSKAPRRKIETLDL